MVQRPPTNISGVVFKLTQLPASWRGDASVKQKLEFFATQRQRI